MYKLYEHDATGDFVWATDLEWQHWSQTGILDLREARDVPLDYRIPVGHSHSTALAGMDFETFSLAGYYWYPDKKKWSGPEYGRGKKGLALVGAAAYSEHPSTEVLSLAYNLRDGRGPQLWLPGMPPPQDLFDHIARGKLIQAWNCLFEWRIWHRVCVERLGWPPLPQYQLRDAMEKARAWALPGALGNCGKVLDLQTKKLTNGRKLLNKFSMPQNPTAKNPSTRHLPQDFPDDAADLYEYNIVDTDTEGEASLRTPDLSDDEQTFALYTRECNIRGVAFDSEAVDNMIATLNDAYAYYNAELRAVTGGVVEDANQLQPLSRWFTEQTGHPVDSLDDATLSALLDQALPDHVRRALEIRKMLSLAGVKKLWAMQRMATREKRLCDLFVYHGARTGRDTGADVQSQNLAKAGPALRWCEDMTCGKPYAQHLATCPHCGASEQFSRAAEWSFEATDDVIEAFKTRNFRHVEAVFGNVFESANGCLRGLLIAAEDHDLLCSDYSSIEAVVAAVIAGEQWRIDAFMEKKDIYLLSASAITGTPYEEYLAYKEQHGTKHPDRQKIGKPAELGLGFGGWVMALYQFGYDGTEDEAKNVVVPWREASPNIVEMWGGQVRGKPWRPTSFELYGLEGCAIAAVQNPGEAYAYRGFTYVVKDDVLYCRLLSGRLLTYHKPRLAPHSKWEGQSQLSFEGWNTNPKMGGIGWIRIETYGGRLFENVVQATARDIMAHAVVNLEQAGYPLVLRVHDELVAEVPKGYGSVEHFEHIMATLPDWAAGWPIRAAGGWRGKRYRKD